MVRAISTRTQERRTRRREKQLPDNNNPARGRNAHRNGHGAQAPSDATREPSRQRLLALRARLSDNVARMAETALNGHGNDTSPVPLDTADFASETSDQEVVVDLLGSTTESLDQIDAALLRLDEGSYGRCEECGCQIPEARLAALPYTAVCVRCASQREQGDGS